MGDYDDDDFEVSVCPPRPRCFYLLGFGISQSVKSVSQSVSSSSSMCEGFFGSEGRENLQFTARLADDISSFHHREGFMHLRP